MNLPTRVLLLAVLGVAQLAAAASSIVRYERTLSQGTLYKIKTVPVDPADPFRGRYVAVQSAITLSPPLSPEVLRLFTEYPARRAYVVLATDEEGFARAAEVVTARPAGGDYLPIASAFQRPVFDDQRLRETRYDIVLPFDRYYMNESAAPAAEQRYLESIRRNGESRTWLTVRVRNGVGVIEGLYIDGEPIEALLGR
jgi:uncharacterized membrane-anchored protein